MNTESAPSMNLSFILLFDIGISHSTVINVLRGSALENTTVRARSYRDIQNKTVCEAPSYTQTLRKHCSCNRFKLHQGGGGRGRPRLLEYCTVNSHLSGFYNGIAWARFLFNGWISLNKFSLWQVRYLVYRIGVMNSPVHDFAHLHASGPLN